MNPIDDARYRRGVERGLTANSPRDTMGGQQGATAMSRSKIKPPPEPKVVLMERAKTAIAKKYTNPVDCVDYLLNFFTSVDLVEIIKDMEP